MLFCATNLYPHSSESKYIDGDLYALPLTVLPCVSVGGYNTRYLNNSHKPIINPL